MNPENAKRCTDCGGEMEIGFPLNMGHAGVYRYNTGWYPGIPERSFWFGLRIKQKDAVPVVAWRCRECGLVKLYTVTERPQA